MRKFILFILLLLSMTIASVPGEAQVIFNNSNSMQYAAGNVLTGSFAITAGTNLVAWSSVSWDNVSGLSIVSITLGGRAMTPAGTASSYGNGYLEWFYLVNPPTGTQTLIVTATSGTYEIYANVVTTTGTNQTTPARPGTYNSTTGSSTTASLSIASNASDITLGAAMTRENLLTTNQTLDGLDLAGQWNLGDDHSTVSGASITDTWTFLSGDYIFAGLSVMAVTASGPPIATLSSTSVAFGNQPVGVASAVKTVNLTNNGGTALTITGVVVSGINRNDFYQSNNCGTSLAAGGTCTINTEVVPASTAVRSATLMLTDSAANSPQTISLSATGIHDVILTWVASISSGVIGYYVYRGTASGKESGTPLNASPVNAVFYVDTTVVPGVTYYYVVTATNGSKQSVASNEASKAVPKGVPIIVTR